MKNLDVQLFIEDREIEFSQDPKILLNYKHTDLYNPTIVKNSFTKTIEIEGTSKNNNAFGQIWDLDRFQYYGSSPAGFSPIKKANFKLFVEGELYERGYCKLDKIVRNSNTIKYSLTLYGSLGMFLYNLSFSTDGDQKLTLADIQFSDSDRLEPNLDFEINKDEVYNAWGQLIGGGYENNDRWRVINYVPCYNGIPADFDSDKVLINNNGISHLIFESGKTEGGTTYTPILNGSSNASGWSLGNASEEMTEWETFDLRSYLQRPALSMYRFIRAICQPENNGGYEVKLDDHFFNGDNPYYTNAWMTLPMLRDIEQDSTITQNISGATLTKNGSSYTVNYSTSLASLNNVNLKVGITFTPTASTSANSLYSSWKYRSKTTATLQAYTFVKSLDYSDGLIVQLKALDSNNSVVAKSKAYLLGSTKYFPDSNETPLWKYFDSSSTVANQYEYVPGYWSKSGSTYQFVNSNGIPVDLDFSFNTQTNFTRLEIAYQQPFGISTKFAFQGINEEYNEKTTTVPLFSQLEYNTTGNSRFNDVISLNRVEGNFNLSIKAFEGVATDYEALFSNTRITKDKLLATDYSPADLLISYCKLFGLLFYQDTAEDSEYPDKYPSGVIHIMDRNTFYTDEVIDLSAMIDFSRNINITPTLCTTKWLSYDLEPVDSECQSDYKDTYGNNYGRQLVNTNYNFNNDTTELYDGNAFRSGIMVREKDKYFKTPVQGIPPYVFNGLTYNLFYKGAGDTEYASTEIAQEVSTTTNWKNINNLGLDYYDCLPKLQLHTKENDETDGSGVLVFLNGGFNTQGEWTNVNYWLTDDVYDMVTLNEASPCWILTNSEYDGSNERIAYKLNRLPLFSRTITSSGQTGNIIDSWDFGHPRVTFVPNVFTTPGDCIYDKCWKNYINDLYDVNTRKLTCYVKLRIDGRPWPYWLRRFYWFENSIWRLNEIKDMNLASYEPTLMEFIKVQDMDNYKLDAITGEGHKQIILNQTEVPHTGGTVTGSVELQVGGNWYFRDYVTIVDNLGNIRTAATEYYANITSGNGTSTNFTLTIPANLTDKQYVWTICADQNDDEFFCASFTQRNNGTGSITITPSTKYISANTTSTTFSLSMLNISNPYTTSSAAWLSGNISGNNLIVTTSENTTLSQRTGTIWVNGYDGDNELVMANCTIVQSGVTAYITNPGDKYLEYMMNSYDDFDIITNVAQVNVSNNKPTYYTVYPTSGSNGDVIGITNDVTNNTGDYIVATWTLSDAAGQASSVTFYTRQKYIPTITGQSTVPPTGATLLYEIDAPYDFCFNNIPSWLTIEDVNDPSKTYAEGERIPYTSSTDYLNFIVSANTTGSARTATNFNMGFFLDWNETQEATTVPISLTQDAYVPFITITPAQITNVPSAGGSYNVTVSASTDWRWSMKPNNVDLSPSAGTSGSTTMTINVGANDTSARTGQVKLVLSGAGLTSYSAAVTISQIEAPYVSVTPTAAYLLPCDSGFSIYIATNVGSGWTVTNYPNWIWPEYVSGPGNRSMDIEVFPNTGNTARTGTFQINGPDGSTPQVVTVTQDPYYEMDVTPLSINASQAGGDEYTFTVSAGPMTEWYTTVWYNDLEDEDWIDVGTEFGLGEEEVYVTISPNNTGSARTATIEVQDTLGCYVFDITITQAG